MKRYKRRRNFYVFARTSRSSQPRILTKLYSTTHRVNYITDTEKVLLARGLNFSVPRRKLCFCDFLIPFEKLFRLIRNEDISPKSRMDTDFIKTRMKDIALTGFKSYTPPKSIFSDDEHKVIKSLYDDDTIYLIKPDKGSGVVIINRADYKARMQDILSDKTKFDLVDNTVLRETLTKETKNTNLLKELKQEEIISEQQFDELNLLDLVLAFYMDFLKCINLIFLSDQ